MPATRLLVIADPKMLPALASGLRASGRFEIATAPFAEPTSLAPLAAGVELVALFYGSRQWPLATSIQELAAGVRGRGVRLVAVLQKEQSELRDGCFRAGASDLLFMPMPKDQFSARLHESASLAFREEEGLAAQIRLERNGLGAETVEAKVCPDGIALAGGPPLEVGDTVQLSWHGGVPFSRWGLVAQKAEGGAKIRFAGASSDEDAQLLAWIKGLPVPPRRSPPAGKRSDPSVPAVPPTVVDAPSAPEVPATLVDTRAVPPTLVDARALPTLLDAPAIPATLLDVKAVAPTLLEVKSAPAIPTPPSVAKAAPPGAIADGPPPGFAARPPIRPQSFRGTQTTTPGRPRSFDTAPPGPGSGSTQPGLYAAASATGERARISDPNLPKVPRPISLPGSKPAVPAATPIGAAPSAPPAAAEPVAAAAAPPPESASARDAGQSAVSSNPNLASSPQSAALEGAAPSATTSAPTPAAAPGQSGLAALFEEPAGATAAAPALEVAPLPGWPTPLDPALARSLLALMLREKSLPSDAPAEPGAAVRKVVGTLPSSDREALELVGPDSHLHEALTARVQLAHANAEGLRLFEGGLGALVDDAGVTALTQTAGAASKRLQGEADRAIAKGEVETLQQVTAASAALSRELLAFKETVDRLHGLAAAPRLGAGALDPNVSAPEAAKPASSRRDKDREKEKDEQRAEQRKQALSDFTGLQDTPKAGKQKRALWIALVIFAAAAANALWFAVPGVRAAPAPLIEQAGTGVLQISLSEHSAIVSVAATWLSGYDRKSRLRSLCGVLDAKGIKQAAIYVDGKGVVGQVEVAGCQSVGLPPPKPPPPELGGPALPGGK